MVIFNNPLIAASVKCTTGVVNDINLMDLYRHAWYINQPTQITGLFSFVGPVTFKEAIQRTTSASSLRISDLQQNITDAIDYFSKAKAELEKMYLRLCYPVTYLYKKLGNAIFEGDYFMSVYEDTTQNKRHSSASFYAFNTSYTVVSWEDSCHSSVYLMNPAFPDLEEVVTVAEGRYGQHWLFLGGTHDVVYIAMASSTTANECNRQNSVIWKVYRNSRFSVHRELAAGEFFSSMKVGDMVRLFLHTSSHTITYRLYLDSGSVQEEETIPELVEHATTLITKLDVIVIFWSYEGQGTLFIDGVPTKFEIAYRIDDCSLLEQGNQIFLLLAVTRSMMHKEEEYILELYLVDLNKKKITWMDVHSMSTKIQFTAFFVGVRASGSHMIVALQEYRVPVVFKIIGETLKEVAHLSTPRVDWTQLITMPHQNVSGIWEHYLLLGQNDLTLVLTKLVMKGAALPPLNFTCDLQTLASYK